MIKTIESTGDQSLPAALMGKGPVLGCVKKKKKIKTTCTIYMFAHARVHSDQDCRVDVVSWECGCAIGQ